jgi:hypothetical protein
MTSLRIVGLLILLLGPIIFQAQEKVSISGVVRDGTTGEELIGATVYIPELGKGASTNVYGFYSITLVKGSYSLEASYMGYETKKVPLELDSNLKLDLEISPSSVEIGTAVVEGTSEAEKNVASVEMSKVRMNMESIKKIPAFMGEVDVIKAIQLLPGVQTVGEGTSGFYVRGGAVDQNLILLDEAPVYNASHLLGFFSVFNSDAIKDVQLYKGGIPARYGGRLSSVLDIRMLEGNNKQYCANGGIGTISSRISLQGPIVKDKSSFLISGRRTYADIFLKLSKDEATRDTKLYFYDLNLKANYKLNDNNRLYASGYFGRDVMGFADLFRFEWGNATGVLRWNHVFNDQVFSNLSFIYSDFDYTLAQDVEGFGFQWDSHITDLSVKYDINYFPNPNNIVRFGIVGTKHDIDPGFARGTGENTLFTELRIPKTHSIETGVYLSNEQNITDRFSAIYGLRFSTFSNMGETTNWNYDDEYQPTDSTTYDKWDIYNTYTNLEPRLGLNYRVNKSTSIKASYNRTSQYIQLASNSTSSSPLDIWFPSTPNVKPQTADQVAIGYFKNFRDNTFEFTSEIYYKEMANAIDFAPHAQLLLNEHIEGELRTGDARAYGLELMVRKQEGQITGLISYTLSRSEKLIPEIITDWYPTKYDKLHDISAMLAYDINNRWSVGLNYVFSTGSAVTMPTGRFEYLGVITPVYSDRNGARMPNYHRLDLSLTLKPKENPDRLWNGEWVLSIYNVYNRHNPYSINFQQEDFDPNITFAEMTYLLPIVPAITYNFKICK